MWITTSLTTAPPTPRRPGTKMSGAARYAAATKLTLTAPLIGARKKKMTKPRYIAHYGGPCPVDPETKVDVVFRCGDKDNFNDQCRAKVWNWKHDEYEYSIIAYRVLTDED